AAPPSVNEKNPQPAAEGSSNLVAGGGFEPPTSGLTDHIWNFFGRAVHTLFALVALTLELLREPCPMRRVRSDSKDLDTGVSHVGLRSNLHPRRCWSADHQPRPPATADRAHRHRPLLLDLN